MQAEYLVVDQRSQREVVEQISEVFPDVGVAVFSETFVVETVHLRNLTRFVITSKNGDARRIAYLQGDKKSDSLDRIVTSIDVVACILL